MRILYVCAVDLTRQFAGTTHVVETVHNLRARGHQVHLVYTRHGPRPSRPDIVSWTYVMPVPSISLLNVVVFHVLLFFYVAFLVVRHRIEAIYEREMPFALGVRLPALLFGVPRVVEVNGLPGDEENVPAPRKLRDRLRAGFQRLDLRLAEAVVVVTDQMRDTIVGRYAVSSKRVFVVPNGVNEELFRPKDKHECRKKLGLEDDRKYVCCVCSFYRYHAIDLLVAAAPAVVQKCPEVSFLLVGDGLERQRCEQAVKAGKLSGSFRFTGAVSYESVPDYICAGDICVFMYRPAYQRHVSPLKLFEYLACGKPTLVATDSPALVKLQRGLCGESPFVLLDRLDASSLAERLASLLADPRKVEDMGKRGREFVRGAHTWDCAARKVETILLSVRRRHR